MNRNTLLGTLLAAGLCGCGTLDNMTAQHSPTLVYGGVRQDVKQLAQSTRDAGRAKDGREFTAALGSGALSALDTPLSAVGDTVTLPIAVGRVVAKSH